MSWIFTRNKTYDNIDLNDKFQKNIYISEDQLFSTICTKTARKTYRGKLMNVVFAKNIRCCKAVKNDKLGF